MKTEQKLTFPIRLVKVEKESKTTKRKKPTKTELLEQMLDDAFEICFLTSDVLGNILASGDFTKEDKEYLKKSKRFIRLYKQFFKK